MCKYICILKGCESDYNSCNNFLDLYPILQASYCPEIVTLLSVPNKPSLLLCYPKPSWPSKLCPHSCLHYRQEMKYSEQRIWGLLGKGLVTVIPILNACMKLFPQVLAFSVNYTSFLIVSYTRQNILRCLLNIRVHTKAFLNQKSLHTYQMLSQWFCSCFTSFLTVTVDRSSMSKSQIVHPVSRVQALGI